MIKLPNIEVSFKQLAGTLIERSERGIVILIVKDDTDKTFEYKEYNSIIAAQKDKALFTTENLKYINDIFNYSLSKLAVVRIDKTGGSMADALQIVEHNIKSGWVTIADATQEEWTTLVSWIKTKETERKTYKAVVYKASVCDCKHIVNFFNEQVTFADERGTVTGDKYCPSLAGILASCNVRKGSTYFKCTNLTSVKEVANNEDAVANGKLILINDIDTVKIALGINSLTTTDGNTSTEDMKYIDTVEAMDIIMDDISTVFKREYLGNYKNNYDNQVLLISAINSYLKQLAGENILDNTYANKVDVDTESQRAAWLGVGKAEAESWSEQKLKDTAFKRSVFLTGDIKILGSMENLTLSINLL